MAAGKPVSDDVKREAFRLTREEKLSARAAAKRLGLSNSTVARILAKPCPVARPADGPAPRLPDPAPDSGGAAFPEPVAESYEPFSTDLSGRWLVLGDLHIPHHDRRTVESAVNEARRVGVAGVLLNGDIMDCGGLSDHARDAAEPDLEEEIEKTSAFFGWLRDRLPRARLIWKEANHETRLPRYLWKNARDLCGSSRRFTLPKLTEAERHGIEWVDSGRVVMLGKLHVLHGHEFKGGGGVNPARWLFLQAVSTAMCGHFHRTSEHVEQALDRRVHGTWSVGCACFLHPRWYRNNKWNHGYALVDVANDGGFVVTNRRILRDGRVV